MKFHCTIPPLNHPELMLVGHGKAILCLAPFVLQSDRYASFVREAHRQGYYVIIDNGAAEELPVSIEELIMAAQSVDADEVVIPDVLLDGDKTIKQVQLFGEILRANLPDVKLMGVPQGKSFNEWMYVYNVMLDSKLVDVIGLSKISVPECFQALAGNNEIMATRKQCVDHLRVKNLMQKDIHILGMGNPDEMWLYRMDVKVRSTDSCYAILAAIHGLEFGTDQEFKRYPTTNRYFEHLLTDEEFIRAVNNIKYTADCVGVWR